MRMHGIKIGKAFRGEWPGEYRRLDVLVRPIAERLRSLWWATGDVVYGFPTEWILESGDGGFMSGPSMRAFDASFVSDVVRPVARPGFLPAYANMVSGDWSALYGFEDNPASDPKSLEALGDLGFFAEPVAFPAGVSVAIRGIDWAYWEVFARERGMIDAVYEELRDVEGLVLNREGER